MARNQITLVGTTQREYAKAQIDAAPAMSVVAIREATRTTEQNSKLWAMLGDVCRQKNWHGVRLSPNDWKTLFMESLWSETRMVPNMGGNGFVNLGRSSSQLTISEMSDMIELMNAWGANNGVTWTEPKGQQS